LRGDDSVVNGFAWPDLALALILLLGTLSGFKRGFVRELAGAVALAFAIAAGFAYRGTWDVWINDRTHMGGASAHITGLLLYAAAAYAIVYALGMALATIAKLPIISTVNALFGAVVGCAKALVLSWAIVFAALFFPLTPTLRDDLHQSRAIAFLQAPNRKIDAALRVALPPFVKPFATELFTRHRV